MILDRIYWLCPSSIKMVKISTSIYRPQESVLINDPVHTGDIKFRNTHKFVTKFQSRVGHGKMGLENFVEAQVVYLFLNIEAGAHNLLNKV